MDEKEPLNIFDVLWFKPVRDSFFEACGFCYGLTEFRRTCRAASILFGAPPAKISADALCKMAVQLGHARLFEIAEKYDIKSYGSVLMRAASCGSLALCNLAMNRLETKKITGIIIEAGLLTIEASPADILLAGASVNDHIGLCGYALGLGAKNYDLMLFYASTCNSKDAMKLAISLGARAKFALHGAATGREAEVLRDAYELEKDADEKTTPLELMECVLKWRADYELQCNRDAFIATVRAIHHDSTSIRTDHLKRIGNPRDQRCVALFRLACEHNCACTSCANEYDFAPMANCAEIWQVALDCRKVTPDRILEVAIAKNSLEMCEFAVEHGATAPAIERMLAECARFDRRAMCEYARNRGAHDFRAMFMGAARNLVTKMCRLAVEWSDHTLDVEFMLRSSAYTGNQEQCLMAVKCGALGIYEAREIARQCGHIGVMRLLENIKRSRDEVHSLMTGVESDSESSSDSESESSSDDESSSSSDDEPDLPDL